MRDGIEKTTNERVRIKRYDDDYHVQVRCPLFEGYQHWPCVAARGNLKEARLIARQFAALVEE